MSVRSLAASVMALALLLAVSVALAASPQDRLVGRVAPRLRKTTLDGSRLDSKKLVGRVVVLEFFAKYCRPCQRRLELANRLAKKTPAAVFVGVSLDETPDAAYAQMRRHKLRFPVVYDAGRVIAGRFRVTALPAAAIIGGDGRVFWVGGPSATHDALRDAVSRAVRKWPHRTAERK